MLNLFRHFSLKTQIINTGCADVQVPGFGRLKPWRKYVKYGRVPTHLLHALCDVAGSSDHVRICFGLSNWYLAWFRFRRQRIELRIRDGEIVIGRAGRAVRKSTTLAS